MTLETWATKLWHSRSSSIVTVNLANSSLTSSNLTLQNYNPKSLANLRQLQKPNTNASANRPQVTFAMTNTRTPRLPNRKLISAFLITLSSPNLTKSFPETTCQLLTWKLALSVLSTMRARIIKACSKPSMQKDHLMAHCNAIWN